MHALSGGDFFGISGLIRAAPTDSHPAASSAVAQQPFTDTRDQYTFAETVAAAQRADLEEYPNAYQRIWKRYNGKRFRWELAYIPLLVAAPMRA